MPDEAVGGGAEGGTGGGAGLALTAPAAPPSLDGVHELLAALWQRCDGASDEDRIRFETAVAEIAGNIIQHSGSGALPFTVELSCASDRLEARFRDAGRRAEVDLTAARMPGALAESGRGLALALAAVDELEYRRVGEENHWRVLRWRSRS